MDSAIKFEAARLHFLSDVFVAVTFVVAWASYAHTTSCRKNLVLVLLLVLIVLILSKGV